jgi:hypothetical protein
VRRDQVARVGPGPLESVLSPVQRTRQDVVTTLPDTTGHLPPCIVGEQCHIPVKFVFGCHVGHVRQVGHEIPDFELVGRLLQLRSVCRDVLPLVYARYPKT